MRMPGELQIDPPACGPGKKGGAVVEENRRFLRVKPLQGGIQVGTRERKLPGGVIDIFVVARQLVIPAEKGHAHVQIVHPQRDGLRPLPRQRAVGQPELLVGDVLGHLVDDGPVARLVLPPVSSLFYIQEPASASAR